METTIRKIFEETMDDDGNLISRRLVAEAVDSGIAMQIVSALRKNRKANVWYRGAASIQELIDIDRRAMPMEVDE